MQLVPAAFVLTLAGPARAAETAADVETDHVDALDDGGPRIVTLAVDVLATSRGWLGVEGEALVVDGLAAHLAVAGGVSGPRAFAHASAGLAWFPARFSFHGWVLLTRVEGTSPLDDVTSPWRIAGALLAGYAWTWPVGAALRLAAGAAYAAPLVSGAPHAGFEPRVDVAAGWTF